MTGLIALFLLLWLIDTAFPNYGGGYIDVARVFVCILIGIIGLEILHTYWVGGIFGILWLGEYLGWNKSVTLILALFGPIAGPMLGASVIEAAMSRWQRTSIAGGARR